MLRAKKTRSNPVDHPGERDPRALGLVHTRRQHARETAEDYVEAIAELIAERGRARVVDLAGRLGVTHVTVNRTVARLQKAGFVSTQPYRAIELTGQGRSLAESSRIRHETVVRFLLSLGVSAHIATIDAEGIEHHVSPETLAAFAAAVQDVVPQGTTGPRDRQVSARMPRKRAIRRR
jgi:DtxR family transcriptional regulator, manganese transport regulator